MSRLVLSVLVATFAAVSIAGARPNTTTMSCEQAAATVARAGKIVLSTGAYTYDLFVAGIQYCMPPEQTEAAYAPTLDSRQCQVGFVCRRPHWFNHD